MPGHAIFCTDMTTPYFVGRCALCGKEGLRLKHASEPCPNGAEELPYPQKGKPKRPKWAAKYVKGWDFTRGRGLVQRAFNR